MILVLNTPVSLAKSQNPVWFNFIKFDLPLGVTMTHPPAVICETEGCSE